MTAMPDRPAQNRRDRKHHAQIVDTASTVSEVTSVSSSTDGLIKAIFGDEPLPDEYSGGADVVTLKVLVCSQCFTGSIKLPLQRDQGIDLDPTGQPIVRRHRCPADAIDAQAEPMRWAFARVAKRGGDWRLRKLVIPLALYHRLLDLPGVSSGPAASDNFS